MTAPSERGREVDIVRDEYGVPHIRAATEALGFFGVGYAQAEDHLPTILRFYLMASGKSAAVFGHEWVPADIATRRWRHLPEARAQFARLTPGVQANLRAFSAGITAFVADHPEDMPGWMPTPEPALGIAVLRMFLWPFMIVDAVTTAKAAGVLDPQVEAELMAPVTVPNAASNEWVVLPGRTAENATVVLSDPHGPIGEFPMFEFELTTPTCHGIGVSAAGCAYPILGHSQDVAWGQTTGAPRVSDCYAVTVEAHASGLRYRYDNSWQPVHHKDIDLPVAGFDTPVRRQLLWTEHNNVPSPVIGADRDVLFVACTPYARGAPALEETLHGWLHARDTREFHEAMRGLGLYPQNTMAGDRHGAAIYVRHGRVPRRPRGYDDHEGPLPGNSSTFAWDGLHPLEDLLSLREPACGYMQNNNVAPDTMVDPPVPPELREPTEHRYLFNDTPGRSNDRGRRARELLGGPTRLRVADILDAALDDRWPTARNWSSALAAAVDCVPLEPAEAKLAALVIDFDGRCSPESSAALGYWYWRTSIPRVASPTAVRDLVGRIEGGGDIGDADRQLMIAALRSAHERMLSELGRTDLTFGEAFRIGRGGHSWPAHGAAFLHSVSDVGPEVTPADVSAVLRVMGFGPPDANGRRWAITGGRSLRLVAFTEPIQSYSVVLYGQSSRPDSPHYSDQCALYSTRTVRATHFGQPLPPEQVSQQTRLLVPAGAVDD